MKLTPGKPTEKQLDALVDLVRGKEEGEARQIPNEGEYCGECQLADLSICKLYNRVRYLQSDGFKRLPECLQDKPQLMTLVDRLKLKDTAYRECREEQIRDELRSEGEP